MPPDVRSHVWGTSIILRSLFSLQRDVLAENQPNLNLLIIIIKLSAAALSNSAVRLGPPSDSAAGCPQSETPQRDRTYPAGDGCVAAGNSRPATGRSHTFVFGIRLVHRGTSRVSDAN